MSPNPTKRVARKKASASPRSKPRRVARAEPKKAARGETNTIPVEVDPNRVEDSFHKIREQLTQWANKGRYTRVRFKFRGKQLLPDLPLAAVLAAEGLTFYWSGILRALIFNIAGQALFEVELVNDAENRVRQGKDELLRGEVAKALEHFRAAISMDSDNANAHLNLGIALKISGDLTGARKSLERARDVDKNEIVSQEADRILASMEPTNRSAGVGSS